MVAFSKERIQTFIGIAAADKAEDSRELWVYCQELLPFVKGELKAREFDTEISTSSQTDSYSGKMKTSNCVLCQYRSTESNRLMPPDVRRGEQVIVTCFSDTNTFYWDTAGVDTGTRRTETYRIGVGDTTEYNTVLTDDNSYFLELDTRRHKHVKISTANSDKEEFRYMLLISPELSQVLLTDNANNSIFIDSKKHHVTLTNTDGSLLNLEAENIVMSCKGNITIDAKEGEIMMHSKKNTTFKTDEHFIHDILKTSTVTAEETMSFVTHKDYKCTADTTYTAQSKENMSFSTEASYSVVSKSDMSLSTEASYSTTSKSDMSYSTEGNYTASAQGTMTLSSQGNFTASSQGMASISATGNVNIGAGGGLSMSFKGSGMCESSGGQMTMKMSRLSIVKG